MAEAELHVARNLEREGRKRKWMYRAAIVAVVVIAIVLAVSYRMGLLPFDEDREYHHTYVLQIDTYTTDEYVIMCPIPTDATGTPCGTFLSGLVPTSDDIQTSVVDTPYGDALEVRGSSDTTLRWYASWAAEDGDWYLNLSIITGDPFDYSLDNRSTWIYSDSEDLNIRFSYSSEQTYLASPVWASGGGPYYDLVGNGDDIRYFEPDVGWQHAQIDFGWVAIN